MSLASGAVADLDRAPATPPANRSFAVSEIFVDCDRLSATRVGMLPAGSLLQADADSGSVRKPGAYGDIRQYALL